MKFGLNDQQYQQFLDIVAHPLKKLNCTVYVFGSRVTSNYHPFSDIDVLYSIPDDANFSREIYTIKENIEESNFPIKVDLVNEAELATSYKNSVFSHRVQI